MQKLFVRLLTIGWLCLATGLGAPPALADEDELADLQDEIARELAGFLDEVAEERQAFRDERDRDFAEFLQAQWQAFDEFAGLIADRTPKPAKVPQLPPAKDDVPPAGPIVAPPPAVKPPEALPAPAVAPPAKVPPPPAKPVPPPAEAKVPAAAPPEVAVTPKSPPAPMLPPAKPEAPRPVPSPPEPQVAGPAVGVEFYGNVLHIPCDPGLRVRLAGALGNRAIADYWLNVSAAEFSPTLDRLLALRKELQLNDWGYYQLLAQTAEAVHGRSNDSALLTWFFLCKSGYQAKVGYADATLYLLVPTAQTLYGVPFYTLGGVRYYNFSYLGGGAKPGRIFTYQEDYPGAQQPVGMLLEKVPVIRAETARRVLKFRYAAADYEIPVTYNPNVIRFFGSYPQADLPVFFSAAIEPQAEASLLQQLSPLVAGKSESEAVNILLRFVQTAFAYKTDEEQFGREKYLFAGETLSFPYSDCEDRSILFSYLVRRLIGLEVVGLHYPGHIATAVRFSAPVTGDRLDIDGKPYVICDPTFINADLGMAMPQFKGVTPEVIRFGI